ncbi:MAG: SpoIIE family protein phosphatase [Actinomycetota bacterium]|nr:SpoIIE family protein phosphatase [Actinomycetota bacterium]
MEDLSYSAHLVLHRLQELRPAKVILVSAVARGLDPPGTVRRYRLGLPTPAPEEVHANLTEAIGGQVALDNMLSVVRHFGGLPRDTVIIEVEAADSSFGLGFSEELATAIDPLLALVREELGDMGDGQAESALAPGIVRASADATSSSPGRGPGGVAADAAPPGITQLLEYAEAHAQVRALEGLCARLPSVPGVAMAARFLPAGRRLGLTADWYDVLPLPGGSLGVVISHVASAPGVQAAGVAAQLKMAVHALALLEGDRPASLVGHLDAVVGSTGAGGDSTLTYLTVEAGGTVRVATAGHCPPLVASPDGVVSLLQPHRPAPALGGGQGDENELVVPVEPGSTVLLFSEALVRAGGRPLDEGLRTLRVAVRNAPPSLEDLCDHVVASSGVDAALSDDDVVVLAVRIVA